VKALFHKGFRASALAFGFAFGFAFGSVLPSKLTPAPLASVFCIEVVGWVAGKASKITYQFRKALRNIQSHFLEREEMSENFEFEEINESEAQFNRRGRKSSAPAELVKALTSLKAGKALRLTSFTVKPDDKHAKKDIARISAMIRSAGKLAGKRVRISWSPTGVPQVMLAPSK